jgi:hypothetical protein
MRDRSQETEAVGEDMVIKGKEYKIVGSKWRKESVTGKRKEIASNKRGKMASHDIAIRLVEGGSSMSVSQSVI